MTRWYLLGAAALLACADPASAASALTFVSGQGKDVGECTRAAPCGTFRYALGRTSAGGVVSALDAAGYGPVTITQSVTIAGPSKGRASIAARGGAGVDVEAPGGTVILRGLQIDGGANGVIIGQAASVVISDVVIVGSSNLAIDAADAGASVFVQDTTALNAGIRTSAATFVAKRVKVFGSPGSGVAPVSGRAVLDDCTISGSGGANVAVNGKAFVKHGVFSSAGLRGISVDSGATAYVDGATTFGNGEAGASATGTTYSYGANNFPDGVSGTIIPISGD